MQRASNPGGASDTLVRVLRRTCYADSAIEVAELLRRMLRTYHCDDDDDNAAEVTALSDRVFRAIPSAFRVGTDRQMHAVYEVEVRRTRHRFVWRELLTRGAYNHVFYAGIGEDCDDPGVVKVTIQSDKDLRVYLTENVLHAILCAIPETAPLVVPLKYAFKLRKSGHPPFRLGTVMADPGGGDLGGWIEDELASDAQMFSVLTQIAWTVYRIQKAVEMQHRDLKVDNIMVADRDDMSERVQAGRLAFTYPTSGLRLLLIDFGMTRLDLGEYVACDCMHRETKFNPSHDLQNLCLTMVEDYSDEFAQRAPKFGEWLAKKCAPLRRKLIETFPGYELGDDPAVKHEQLSFVVKSERMPQFTPEEMLKVLSKHVGSK